jgi:ubiquitin carboxyl-terminal hydrolase 6/32
VNCNFSDEDTDKSYPYTVRMVKREGLFCCRCPWYKFCRGCVIECDDTPIGDDPQYLAIDWDDAFLHLKYQSAQERPKDDESMEALKQVDNQPIDLDDCFASFSKPEELGEDELWWVWLVM